VVKRPPPAAAKATPVAKVTEKHPVAAKAASVKPAEIRPKAAPRPTAGKPVEARPAAQPAQLSEPVAPPPEAPASAPAAATPSPATPPSPAPAAAGPAPAPAPGPGRPMMPDRIPPRPPAKAEIFVEGDHVVYPTHGVGKVERIATEEIAGHKLELIHITFEENRMTLRVPVAKARTAGLRKLATRKLFDEALAVLKGRARIKRTMWSRRAQEYEAKINSGDPLAIAEVVRDLHRNSGQPDQSFSERQIYEAAMDRLAAELAALDKTDKLTAATKLTNFLKTV
jgi:CarD family transcriptional regulator